MYRAFGSLRSGALLVLAWLMLGLALAGLLAGAGAPWSAGLLFALPLTLVYGCASGFSAYYLCRARPLAGNGAWSQLVVFGLAAASAALVWTAAGAAWSALWRALAPGWGALPFGVSLAASMFGLGVVLYGLCAVANYLAIEVDRARQFETLELRTRLVAQEAQLRVLRTQVDPHFLFNSLNSISALTSIDPALARDMTLQLAGFFRQTLALEARRQVTLDAEMELVRRFLAIEQVRFGSRLAFEERVGDDARACLLPPMLLQPLVENAVKHGIGRMLEPGTIRVEAARAGSILRISVENDIDPQQGAPREGSGIGLANVRQRLAAAYGHEAGAHWSQAEGRFRVELSLPAENKEIDPCV
jgi:two-component system, LytTR family, sensor histidine kinase AlgZ